MNEYPAELEQWPDEIWDAFAAQATDEGATLLIAAVVGGILFVAAGLTSRTAGALATWQRRLSLGLTVLFVGAGLYQALQEASLFDDAFITFRYVDNFLEGHGLVFNTSERVEGYTNFLWAMLIAAVTWVTGFEIPSVGFHLSLVCFAANLVVIPLIAKEASATAQSWWVPPAVLALCVGQFVFTAYGTTGLETGAASLWVNLGALFLLRLRHVRDAAVAGLFLILATLTRPDHALFYATGSLVLVVDRGPDVLRALRARAGIMHAGLAHWLAFAAPVSLYLAHLAWRISYYGEPLPNTAYAKSAELTYWPMGKVYAMTFYLSSHAWLLLVATLVWAVALRAESRGERRLKVFVVVGVALYNVYVARVGGDFMFGRFYVSTLPLVCLGAACLLGQLANLVTTKPQRALAAVMAGLVACTVVNLDLVRREQGLWYQTDETWLFSLESIYPPVNRHRSYVAGKEWGALYDAGIRPTIATSGVGLVGYYGRLEVIDVVGLTDAFVAKQPIKERGRPGHEKHASLSYLRDRGVTFKRRRWNRYGKITQLKLGRGGEWHIFRYDPALMASIRRVRPKWRFVDFPRYLDRQLSELERSRDANRGRSTKALKKLRKDARFYAAYYFDHHDDPARQGRLRALLDAEPLPKKPPRPRPNTKPPSSHEQGP